MYEGTKLAREVAKSLGIDPKLFTNMHDGRFSPAAQQVARDWLNTPGKPHLPSVHDADSLNTLGWRGWRAVADGDPDRWDRVTDCLQYLDAWGVFAGTDDGTSEGVCYSLGTWVDRWELLGFTPEHVEDLIDASDDFHHVSPWFYGWGVTAEQFVAFASVGTSFLRDGYTRAGLDLDSAALFAQLGVPEGAVLLAKALHLPANQWASTLTGFGPDWVTLPQSTYPPSTISWDGWDPIEQSPLPHGWALHDLAQLAKSQWARDLTPRDFAHFTSIGNSPVTLTLTGALKFSDAGVSAISAQKWAYELTNGATNSYNNGVMPPLITDTTGESITLDQLWHLIAHLYLVGVRPPHLTVYRTAGCRTTDEVITARHIGITPAIAKRLVAEHGTSVTKKRKLLRIADFATLRSLWEDTQQFSESPMSEPNEP